MYRFVAMRLSKTFIITPNYVFPAQGTTWPVQGIHFSPLHGVGRDTLEHARVAAFECYPTQVELGTRLERMQFAIYFAPMLVQTDHVHHHRGHNAPHLTNQALQPSTFAKQEVRD
jgi:hypothetical protein